MTVVDAATNQPLCDAEVTVTDGGFRETLPVFPGSGADCRYSGPFERPGTYEVTVRRAGYPTAVQSNVRVTLGRVPRDRRARHHPPHRAALTPPAPRVRSPAAVRPA